MSSGEVDSNSCGQWNSWWGRNQGLCLQKQRPEGKCGHSEPGSLLLPGYMSKEESAAEQPVSSDVRGFVSSDLSYVWNTLVLSVLCGFCIFYLTSSSYLILGKFCW